MLPREFIEKVFLRDLCRMVGFLNYLSFMPIVLGVEFLGACLDEKEFNYYRLGITKDRMYLAIQELMPRYEKRKERILDLRHGFAHYCGPKPKIFLTHRKEWQNKNVKHLEEYRGAVLLVVEEFYNDFAKACEEVIRRIDNKQIKHEKVYKDFLINNFSK